MITTARHHGVTVAALGVMAVLGAGLALNGVVMLVDPIGWYAAVPGVTDTGPFNQHFIRDIGLIFVLVGAAYGWGALQPAQRPVLWLFGSLFLAGHALFHLWEVAVGICSSSAIARDLPAVTLPALIGLGFTAWAWVSAEERAS